MEYVSQLEQPEWKKRRREILNRDNYVCQQCKNANVVLGTSEFRLKQKTERLVYNKFLIEVINSASSSPINLLIDYKSYNTLPLEKCNFYAEKFNQDFVIVAASFLNKKNLEWIVYGKLHVHHSYYQEGFYAWEYPDTALQTLCWRFHEELHRNEKIPVRDAAGNYIGEYTYCYRCHGAGLFPEFIHVEKGICFRCNGARYEELIVRPETERRRQ